MKKLISLLMAVCLCVSVCCLFASCGGSSKVAGQGSEPDVYEIEYHSYVINSPKQTVTYGKDADGNIHCKVIKHYSAAPEESEYVLIKQAENSYKKYEYNAELNNYEFKEDVTGLPSQAHLDYFRQGWSNKNNPKLKDYDCVEIGIDDVEAEDSAKGLLEELGCKLYKYQSADEDGYAIMAVLPELDIVLHYGTNFEGYGSQAEYYGGEYEVKFLVKDFSLTNTDNYADLVK